MDPVVSLLSENLAQPVHQELKGGLVTLYSHRSPESEGPNEDSALAYPVADGIVLAVADGAGGGPEGDRAARLAIESLNAELRAAGEQPPRTAILDAFEQANQRVLALGVGAGTTLSVVEIQDSGGVLSLRSFHAGDSSVLVTGNRGKIKFSSTPHSPVGYGVAAGLIEPHDALHHDDLNLVSNLIGISDMRVEMGSPLALAQRDTVVLGTDGLFDNLHVSEIVEITRKGPLVRAAEALVEQVNARMSHPTENVPSKPDDLTFILFRPHPIHPTAPRSGRLKRSGSHSSSHPPRKRGSSQPPRRHD